MPLEKEVERLSLYENSLKRVQYIKIKSLKVKIKTLVIIILNTIKIFM